MNKSILFFFSLISLASCKNASQLKGSWVSAYSYSENDTTKNAHYVDQLPALLNFSESGLDVLFFKLGGEQNINRVLNPKVSKNSYLSCQIDGVKDSLRIVSVNENEVRLSKSEVTSVYKKLATKTQEVSLPDNFSFLGAHNKKDGDWNIPTDFISDTNYISKIDSVPTIRSYKWIDFNGYRFLSLDGFAFWPFLLTEVNEDGFKLKKYGRENGEVEFRKENKPLPKFSLNGQWQLQPKNSLSVPDFTEGLDTTQLQMTLLFQDNKVWVSQYGQRLEKEFLWSSDHSILYFKNEISNIFPTWQVANRTENTLELIMIPYNTWDASFKIYKYSFLKEVN